MTKRVVLAITGATGSALAIRLVELLSKMDSLELHMIVSPWARRTLEYECDIKVKDLENLADVVHRATDLGAALSSGSFYFESMIVAPCSMKTLAAIANSYGDNLISRTADVALKERRNLVLVARETPLHEGHLSNMVTLARRGAVIFPPVITGYHKPNSLTQLIDYIAMRVLDQINIKIDGSGRWRGDELS